MPYSLTAVVARDVNLTQIPVMADFFFSSKALSLMFQPAAIIGKAFLNFKASSRLTIDEVTNQLETFQTRPTR